MFGLMADCLDATTVSQLKAVGERELKKVQENSSTLLNHLDETFEVR